MPTQIIENQLRSLENIERYPAGVVLFKEGDEPRGAYIGHSGQVDLSVTSKKGVVLPLRTASNDDIVGLEAIMAK